MVEASIHLCKVSNYLSGVSLKLTAKITYHACYCSFFYVFRSETELVISFFHLVFGGLLANFMSIETQQKINALTDSFVFNELQ